MGHEGDKHKSKNSGRLVVGRERQVNTLILKGQDCEKHIDTYIFIIKQKKTQLGSCNNDIDK